MKNGPKPKNQKIVKSSTIKARKQFKLKEEVSFFANTKVQVDQIKRKIVAKFNKPLFI